MAVTFKINTREFDQTMREYMKYTKRDVQTIVNTKAYYIARRAVAETPMAESPKIRAYLLGESGRIAGMIINKRRGQRGEKGLYGKEMLMAVKSMLAARLRSRGFIKSGWLWAVKKLAPYAEKISGPSLGRGASKINTSGQPKGGATPAMEGGWSVRAKILNTVTAAWDERDGAAKVAEPALARAFEFERQSMLAYIEKKLRQSANSLGIRTR
jgi:hypothetical protein